MTGYWDPPALLLALAGAAALAAWLALAPPRRSEPGRSALRLLAAAILVLALLDAGVRRAEAGGRRLVVLIDRSLSMSVADAGPSRAEAAREWLEGPEFAAWSAGWTVTRDSFGGTRSDPGAAVDRAAAGLPDAILLLSDGRAASGRPVDPPPVPLYVRVPGAAEVEDAAVLDLAVDAPSDGPAAVVVDVAAVGGRAAGERRVVVTADGRAVGEASTGPLAPGEPRAIRIPLSAAGGAERVIEARLEPADLVPGNDRRARVWAPPGAARRALLVGLRPGWEMAAWRGALERAHPGPVDAFWSGGSGGLRPARGGAARPWSALDRGAYRLTVVVGDPAAAGPEGAAWLAAFAGAGGRGLAWLPEGRGGTLPGAGETVPPGAGGEARPALTAAGRAWLAGAGSASEGGPTGAPEWPPLAGVPDGVAPGAGAAILFEAGGRPVAWSRDRGDRRSAVLLGTGWYRWPLAGEGPARFWEVWSGTLVRWLGAAQSAELALVRLPEGARVVRGEPLRAEVLGDPGEVLWAVSAADGRPVADGRATPDPAGIRAGPFPPGSYVLEARAGDGRRTRSAFVVESWAPDLAWTAADGGSLARAAEASGGAVLGAAPHSPLAVAAGVNAALGMPPAGGPGRGLGSTPWAYLLAAGLILGDWVLAGRRRGGA